MSELTDSEVRNRIALMALRWASNLDDSEQYEELIYNQREHILKAMEGEPI